MATTKTETNVPEAIAAPVAVEPELSINDFCARLSETITRPELIGAFAHVERAAGRVKDTGLAYRARYDLFVNQPV